ncbi:MAG: 30S ribosomal protein S11 [Candidatus Omnitrophota bacterium]
MAKYEKKKKKKGISIPAGVAHIKASFNNTFIAITDPKGNVLTCVSTGQVGFKGTRKGTPYAAGLVAREVARRVQDFGLKEVEVRVKGPGPGRETAIRALQSSGIIITQIRDVSPIPHNGCRPPKERRV